MSLETTLQTGTLVKLVQVNVNVPIKGRTKPMSLLSKEDVPTACVIPDGAHVLYVSSKLDELHEKLSRLNGPFGFQRKQRFYHFVLWEGRPVWVSTVDAYLVEIT